MALSKHGKKQTRKRKRDLVAPQCRENCQRGHNVEQAAALIGISVRQLWALISANRIETFDAGLGKSKRRYILIPHQAIYKFQKVKAA